MKILEQHILLVEDDENDAFFVTQALKQGGFVHAPQHVRTGLQAMEYLSGEGPFGDRTRFPLPGLVLLDLQLPCKHGFDVLRWIRSQATLRKVVVVVLTNSGYSKDIAQAYKLGARSFLVKPTNREQLSELVESLKITWSDDAPEGPAGENRS